jgi:hypothetical protein
MHENWQPCGSQPFLALKAQEDHVLMTQTSGACILTRSDDGQLEALYTDLTNYSLPIVDLKYEQGQLWPLHSEQRLKPEADCTDSPDLNPLLSSSDSKIPVLELLVEDNSKTGRSGLKGEHQQYNRRRMLIACCGNPQIGCTSCNASYCDRCESCTNLFFLDTVGDPTGQTGKCIECATAHNLHCETCTKTACTACFGAWAIDPSNSSNCICPSNAFIEDGECYACIPGCNNCSSAGTCDQCKPFYTYSTVPSPACTPCTPGCETCFSLTQCSNCQANFRTTGLANNRVCTPCPTGQYWTAGDICKDCNTTLCTECRSSSTFCTACSAGLTLNPGEGVCFDNNCGSNMYFFFGNRTCQACNASCNQCSNTYSGPNECKSCNMANSTKLWREDVFGGHCVVADNRTSYDQVLDFKGQLSNQASSDPSIIYTRYDWRLVGPGTPGSRFDWFRVLPTTTCDIVVNAYSSNTACRICAPGLILYPENGACGSVGLRSGRRLPAGDGNWNYGVTVRGCKWQTGGNCTDCIDQAYMDPTGYCSEQCDYENYLDFGSKTCVSSTAFCIVNVNGTCFECAKGYFLDALDLLCKRCPPGCKTCTSAAATSCLTCYGGYHRLPTGECKIRCPAGFYLSVAANDCLLAAATCNTADTSAGTCTSCLTPTETLLNGACVAGCALGEYFETTNSSCTPCDSSCRTCTGPTSTDCLTCNKTHNISGVPGSCSAFACETSLVDEGCAACSGTNGSNCILPPTGQYLNFANHPFPYITNCPKGKYLNWATKLCANCHAACEACTGASSGDCVYCAVGYFRQGTLCVSSTATCDFYGGETIASATNLTCIGCNVTNCLVCPKINQCTECETGFYAAFNGTCQPCKANTVYCQALGISLGCAHGYRVLSQGSTCEPACLSNQYYDGNKRQCFDCAPDCISCVGIKTNCTDCRPGDYLYSQFIPFTLKKPCYLRKSTALQGYYLSGGGSVPKPCPYPCLTCTSLTMCLSCYRGYFVDGSNACLPCTAPCYECSGSATTCTSCHMGYELIVSTCSQICEDYEYFNTTLNVCVRCPLPCRKCAEPDPTVCLACYTGKYLLAGDCVPCHETCANCTGPLATDCDACMPSLNKTGTTCESLCLNNSYLNTSAAQCYACHKFCKTCSGPSPYNCTTCLTGYTLETNTFTVDLPAVTTGFCKKTCPTNAMLNYPYPNECLLCYPTCATCASPSEHECLTCKAGFFLNSGKCQTCHAFCATCDGPTPFNCTACPATAVLEVIQDTTGYCKPNTCLAGQSINFAASTCNTCHPSCATCTGPASTDCYTCPPSKILVVSNMSCVGACPIQNYYNSTSKRCLNCDPSCAYCTDPNATNCLQCMAGGSFVQVNSSLCDVGCAPRSYFDAVNGTHCQPCDDTCETCFAGTDHSCSTCFDPKVRDIDFACKDFCTPGYFANGSRICVNCTYSCRNCTTNGFFNCTDCFEDRFLRNDSACILKCLLGFYYEYAMDSCRMCDVSCKNCTSYTPNDCIECADNYYVQLDGTCKNYCPPGTYIAPNKTCQLCDGDCETCKEATALDCLLCRKGFYMAENRSCVTDCEPLTFPDNDTRTCKGCDPNCETCFGPTSNNCLSCFNTETFVLSPSHQCIDCFNGVDLNPNVCNVTALLKLEAAPQSVTNLDCSETILLSFKDVSTFLDRLAPLNISELIKVKIPSISTSNYTWAAVIRKEKIVIDFNFTKEMNDKIIIEVLPARKAILKNNITNSTELIFFNRTATYAIQAKAGPDARVIGSLKAMASSAETSSAGFSYAIAALCSSVMMFPQLVSPLMKIFRIFKMLSRLRLINIFFGSYLEIFLTVCNMLFTLGGDEISKEALEAAPDTRGKLTMYRVTAISVKPMTIKFALLCLITAIRIYRDKIRRYAVKQTTLSWGDAIVNRIAESARVTVLASLGLDILFYSSHCVTHLRWASQNLQEDSKHSLWLSLLAIAIISVDCFLLVDENHQCTFSLLRKEFRWQRIVASKQKKEESPEIVAKKDNSAKTDLNVSSANLPLSSNRAESK